MRTFLIWVVLLGLAWGAIKLMEPPPPRAPADLSAVPGVRLFYRYECGRCHHLASVPGAVGRMGPPLDGIGERSEHRVPGQPGREYLKRSLVEPGKFLVEGYINAMPSFAQLSPAEINELVEFLKQQ